jgi:uncharacterized protein (TIGR02145 family)
MRAIKILLIGIAAVSVGSAQTQPVNISGKVTDTGTTPIAGATVILEKGGFTTTSRADGSFTLSGSVGVLPVKGKLLSNGLSAGITGNLMTLTIAERSAVEIATFDLTGKSLSTVRQTMETGVHTIALPQRSAGVYLFRVKTGNGELLLKGSSVGGATLVRGALSQDPSSKQAKAAVPINDVIAATKSGYLNYRCVQYSSDTSGIVIKMIHCEEPLIDVNENVYQTVRIGGQVWMAENLRVTRYNDGTAITKITDSAAWCNIFNNSLTTPAYCFYNNTSNADSIKKYGALYNWYTVNTKKLAPTGWHVPTDSEWEVMQSYLVMHGYSYDGTTDTSNNKIAMALAAKTDWVSYSYTGVGCPGNNLTKNNSSGFSALPGGDRFLNGNFYDIGYYGFWWSATEDDASSAWYRYLGCGLNYLGRSGYVDKSCGFSVRLVRD